MCNLTVSSSSSAVGDDDEEDDDDVDDDLSVFYFFAVKLTLLDTKSLLSYGSFSMTLKKRRRKEAEEC